MQMRDHVNKLKLNHRKNILLLHGFGGRGSDWDRFLSGLHPDHACAAPTIPGHAGGDSLADLKIQTLKELAIFFCHRFSMFLTHGGVICGYSLGGRLATLMAKHYKTQGRHVDLALFSSGLGLVGGNSGTRIQRDLDWSNLLNRSSEEFWKQWYEQDLFSTIKNVPEKQTVTWMKTRRSHNNRDLSEVLRTMSPALHEDLSPILETVDHLQYFVGEEDQKYRFVANEIEVLNPNAKITVLPKVGHNLLLEAPRECAREFEKWIEEKNYERQAYKASGHMLEDRSPI